MSAVFEAVGDLVEGVVDAVGDAVEWVGDTVSNVVEAALDDPVKAALQIGVIAATGGAATSLFGMAAPLTAMQASIGLAAIEGVDVLEEGGDIDDAFKAAATSFAVGQAVSFGMDAFSAAGPTDLTGSATTQFFDDGSSIQFFDDGSRLITDSAGAVSSVPAVDIAAPVSAVAAADTAVSLAQPSTSVAPISSGIENVFDEVLRGADSVSDAVNDLFSRPSEFLEQFYQRPETFPVLSPEGVVYGDEFVGPAMPEVVGNVAPGAISPENVPVLTPEGAAVLPVEPMGPPAPEVVPKGAYYPDTAEFVSTTLPAQPQYETMEQLLLDRGLITPEQALEAVAPVAIEAAPPDIYDMLPDSFGEQVAIDPNAPAIDPNAPAAAAPQYETMEDLLYDKGLIDDKAYRELTGVAPVVDRSVDASTLPPAVDRPLSESLIDLGKAAGEYAIEHPFQTAAVIGGGLALAGGEEEQPAPTEAAKKTYTYGAAPPIRRTGLQELYSAASSIYGDDYVRKQLGIQAPPPPAFQSSFQPLLSGQAPGASRVGLGSLGQGFTYTPMGSPQTFDISTLTPEQIIQLQDMVSRRKQPGGG